MTSTPPHAPKPFSHLSRATVRVSFFSATIVCPTDGEGCCSTIATEERPNIFSSDVYCVLLFSSPFIIGQLILFLLPGLTKKETRIILPLLLSSLVLFGLGLIFSYYTLIPAALNFFLNYSEEVLEPFWSFDQYFEFVLVLFYSTGLAFQIPIIQILIGLLNIVSAKQMLGAWRYIILMATILGAILTPSTDPLTQMLLSAAILLLYFAGLGILFLIKN